ncbi:hypothetical protein [Mesonia sp. K4-1]|uniref:hypothetical protein n=1 Tax=Mesonia sp. K4-1 TaxID=2602760 RepID=UPI0011C91B8F|nr:hypothetical protein [Mesonia sp. K4-1]TXK78706.1 hypothetical protein FT986_02615 [Mesonia sp. K4-1]
MNNKNLSSIVGKTRLIKWKNLKFIQDENFKEWIGDGNDKLIESILKYQFADPFKVWAEGDDIYCLDGKHRYLDLIEIEEKGIEVPEVLPATFINCKNEKEAAELVLIYSSQYAKITEQGLLDFTSKFEIDLPSIQGLNLNLDITDPFKDLPFPDELTADKKEAPPVIKITFLNSKQLDAFEKELEMMQETQEFTGIKYSVSQGEI